MIVTLDEYKEFLGIADDTEDAFILSLANAEENRVKDFLNNNLELDNYIDIVDGGGDAVVLKNFPIASVSKIEYYEGLDENNQEIWTTMQAGIDYDRIVIVNNSVVYLDNGLFPDGENNIKITYSAGYTIVPYEIQLACKELVMLTYNKVRGKTLGLSSVNLSSGASSGTSYNNNAENKILSSIRFYRTINI